MSQTQRRNIAGGIIIGSFAVAAFAAGAHFAGSRYTGHDLVSSHATQQQRPAVLARYLPPSAKGIRVADSSLSAAPSQTPPADALPPDGPRETFDSVYDLLKSHFVDTLPSDTQMGHGAASAMLASLGDFNSRFLEPDQFAVKTDEAKGIYHGIGASLSVRKVLHRPGQPGLPNLDTAGNLLPSGDSMPQKVSAMASKPTALKTPSYHELQLTVIAPLPGSPAEKAGLLPGDVITSVNNQWINPYPTAADVTAAYTPQLKAVEKDPVTANNLINALNKKLDGALLIPQAEDKLDVTGTAPVIVTVVRPGAPKPITLTLDVSAPTTVPDIESKTLTGDIGYLKITQLTDHSPNAVQAAISGFGDNLKGLVVDLRNSPGGLLDATSAVAGQLMTGNTLGSVERQGKTETAIGVTPARKITCPVIVLVNGGTANTSELLASALQAQGIKLVGTPTFGDAADVEAVRLRDASGFTMTVGQYKTASHTVFAGTGIQPNIVVPETPGTDAPLTRALSELSPHASAASSRGSGLRSARQNVVTG